MSALWTAEDLAQACGGTLHGADNGTSWAAHGVSIDTRTLEKGDLFVALGGVRDGHEFVSQAFEKGAAAALVQHDKASALVQHGPLVAVPDVLQALEKVGGWARARTSARIAAITGSVGKTSTKEMLRHLLSRQGRTHASVASYNNHFGVPLTLARMPKDTEFGVFEIGMSNAFEIVPLSNMVKPHIAAITAVEPVHLASFSGMTGIADAKGEIFSGLQAGGIALINRDNPHFERIKAHAMASRAGRIVSFGVDEKADIRLLSAALKAEQSAIVANVFGHGVTYKLGAPGQHMAVNSLLVLGIAHLMGADLALAALAMQDFSPATGRGTRSDRAIGQGHFLLIDESYNANPASMRAALQVLAQTSVGLRGRRIAVIGDMLELGPSAEQLHAEIAQDIAANRIDLVFTCGPLSRHCYDAVSPDHRGAHASDSAMLEQVVLNALRPGDAVMIKGSNGSKMGRIIAAAKARFPEFAPAQRG
jgi:UDP-N-acetylmuramoyl-tripeptide--D-alanyl-D-alanine ligase